MILVLGPDPNTDPGTELLSSSETGEGALGGASSTGAVFLICPAMRVGATSCAAMASGETGAGPDVSGTAGCAGDGAALGFGIEGWLVLFVFPVAFTMRRPFAVGAGF